MEEGKEAVATEAAVMEAVEKAEEVKAVVVKVVVA